MLAANSSVDGTKLNPKLESVELITVVIQFNE